MKKFYNILFIVLFYGCSKNKQNINSETQTSDSIHYYLKNSNLDLVTEKNKIKYNLNAFRLIQSQNKNIESKENLDKIISNFFSLNEWNGYNEASILLLKKAKETNDSTYLAKSERYRGNYFYNFRVLDSAFYHYIKAEKLYLSLKDNENYGVVLLKKGIVQFTARDFLGADISLRKSYNILKDKSDKQKLFVNLNTIGLVSKELKEYDKSIEYHNKALKVVNLYKLNTDEHQEAICLNNLGLVYHELKNYKKSIYYFKIALSNKNISKDSPELYTYLLDNFAYSKLYSKDYIQLPDLFYKSLSIRVSLHDTSNMVSSNIHLSEYYAKTKDTAQSILFVNKSLKLAKEINIPQDILAALKQSAVIDKKNASKYTSDYIRINDSLQDAERKSKDRFARIQLETDELLQENGKLHLASANNIKIAFGFCLFITFGFLVRQQYTRNIILEYKQVQQRSNAEIYNLLISQQATIDRERLKEKIRISQDLHDGILGRMFGTRLNLDSLNSREDQEAIGLRRNFLIELRQIEQDIREISHDLNREKFVLINNFVAIVNNLLEDQNSLLTVKVRQNIDLSINWNIVANDTKINLYRVLQESLQNINKYSQAKNVTVELKKENKNIVMLIVDDGVGFDVAAASRKGIGIKNMTTRINDCSGIFLITSQKGNGTTTTVTVPLEQEIIEPVIITT